MAETQKALADRLFPVVLDEEEVELKNIPPEQRRLHTETADLTVSSLHQYMANNKLEIHEFQRGYVWNRTQASRLIETLIIQCPIPIVYFSQAPDNKLIIIDVNQRLLSIKLYLNDGFELQGLTTYPELNGYTWSSLDPRLCDHINNRTLRCITILKDTHPQIKFDVFERLNRHGLNHGPFMKALDDLAKNKKWRDAVGIRTDKRMKGAELLLRYFAFRHDRPNYSKPLSSFLNQFSGKNKILPEATVKDWSKDFNTVMERIDFAFGRLAFRIYENDIKTFSGFNSALYDAEMIGFAETTNSSLLAKKFDPQHFRKATFTLFKDEKFSNSIRQATSDEVGISKR